MTKVTRNKAKQKAATLKPVRPNAGLEAAYRSRLTKLIDEMNKSYKHWLEAAYKRNETRIVATDASPADALMDELSKLGKRWRKNFDKMAEKLAIYFSLSTANRTDTQLRKIMKDAGWTVEFTMTQGMRDIKDAVVHENVALIKSIPAMYHAQVEGIVMRGITAGNDLAAIAPQLQKQFGSTKKRAALIARDQTNKANAVFNKVRMLEIGITQAQWVHSHAGKVPRPTHAKAGRDKVVYNIAEGWYDPDPRVKRHIHPGELINCRCISKALVPGFS